MQSLHPDGKGLMPLCAWIFGWDGLESETGRARPHSCLFSAHDPSTRGSDTLLHSPAQRRISEVLSMDSSPRQDAGVVHQGSGSVAPATNRSGLTTPHVGT